MDEDVTLASRIVELANRIQKFSGLERFAHMLRDESRLSVESHGSVNRPRYSAALAAFAFTASLGMNVSALAENIEPIAPHITAVKTISQTSSIEMPTTFTMSDSTLSRQARNQLADYSLRDIAVGAEKPNGLVFSAASYMPVKKAIFNFSPEKKTSCDVNLIRFPGGGLLPEKFYAKDLSKLDMLADGPPLDAITKADRMLVDRLILSHEDSHCDAVTWSLGNQEIVQSDMNAYNSSSHALSERIEKASSGNAEYFPSRNMMDGKSPKEFSDILIGERYADTRAALNTAQYMLIQKAFSINDYSRVMNHFISLRKFENDAAEKIGNMNDHDTYAVLNETVRLVERSYSEGESGMKQLFGTAASPHASSAEMQDWHDKSSELSRSFAKTSIDVQTDDIIEVFTARLKEHVQEIEAMSIKQDQIDKQQEAEVAASYAKSNPDLGQTTTETSKEVTTKATLEEGISNVFSKLTSQFGNDSHQAERIRMR